MDIKRLKKTAQKAMSDINGENLYNSKYVLRRLNLSLNKHPHDPVLGTIRDVVKKIASKQEFISKKELTDIYRHFEGFNKQSYFRDEMGDLILKKASVLKSSNDASGSRINQAGQLKPLVSEGSPIDKMAKEFAGVFNLNQKSFSEIGHNSNKKASKFVELELKALGCTPKSVTAVKSNDHFILCKASFSSSRHKEVGVAIPVKVNSGVAQIPTHFIEGGKLKKLSRENLFSHLKISEESLHRSNSEKFAAQRDDMFDQTWTSVKSVAKNETPYEERLLRSRSSFSESTINSARSFLKAEASTMGFVAPQIKYASSDKNKIIFDIHSSNIDGPVRIPVGISNLRPLYPQSFIYKGRVHKLSSFNVDKIASSSRANVKTASFDLHKKNYNNMSYYELVNEISDSASNSDYKSAEDCLSVIQRKFGSQEYLSALNKYSSLLKISSRNEESDSLIKAAVQSGDLIKIPTSVELYSPKYGLPLSKLAFDNRGSLIPIRNTKRANNVESESLTINTSKIIIS